VEQEPPDARLTMVNPSAEQPSSDSEQQGAEKKT